MSIIRHDLTVCQRQQCLVCCGRFVGQSRSHKIPQTLDRFSLLLLLLLLYIKIWKLKTVWPFVKTTHLLEMASNKLPYFRPFS